ncbi:MAG: DUF389 domain-containing protein [Ottowia sp.]|nr:DUF389 domain-containing protein [Ottowia sp.]
MVTRSNTLIILARIRSVFAKRFSLHVDKANDDKIDAYLRGGVELTGATPWILMFAIFIASVGLNVNSTAVIIGAMLISPLMGPIMGIGYGVGIYDFPLIKRSFVNLGIATAISLLTSTFYFLVSPLSEAQSELFARTTPTIWDVLIVLFGGLAGIVGATRKEKSNVIPGVAIATALMPPLCTAGFGLAHGNWGFFFGAAYLFSINCVFIAVSTAVVISFLSLPHRNFVDKKIERRVKKILLLTVAMTALPSFYLAYQLVGDEFFKNHARAFVKREFQFKNTHVADVSIMPTERRIEMTLIGEPVDQSTLDLLNVKLAEAGLQGASIKIHQSTDNKIDLASIKEGILGDLYQRSMQTINEQDKTIQKLQRQLSESDESVTVYTDILHELQAQYQQIKRATVGRGQVLSETSSSELKQAYILFVSLSQALSTEDKNRLTRWFRARTKDDDAQVVIEAASTVTSRSRSRARK